ncbi:hypothetical protein [Pseudomonas sp. KCJK8993]|uniref:hypothetical protein n=1 Tax=Pseudomonas sp. KCJK8993 TaxID=3344565 RepID=UPI0039058CF8
MHINPDHFLQTENGRIINAELNRLAWQRAHLALSEALLATPKPSRLYLLIGAQGAGKSTWAKSMLLIEPSAVIFDAILVQRCERESLIQIAKKHELDVVAIFLLLRWKTVWHVINCALMMRWFLKRPLGTSLKHFSLHA